jgi:hypothetical protein
VPNNIAFKVRENNTCELKVLPVLAKNLKGIVEFRKYSLLSTATK